MRILLANPPYRISIDEKSERFFIRAGSRWPFSVTKQKKDRSEYMPFPFYLAYTAALLEKETGIDVFVLDSIAMNQTEEEFIAKVEKINPDIILFETATNTIKHDIALSKKIKQNNSEVKICLAGFHVTTFVQETFNMSDDIIDFLMLREYELNFVELVKYVYHKKDYANLPGISFVKNGKLVKNESTDVTPVEKLPFPARHLFPANDVNDLSVYWDGFCQYKPAIQMHASRGCPFRCNFCVWNQIMYKNSKYRPRDSRLICDEIELVIKDYGAKEVYFDDDTFTGNKEHVVEFCDEMMKRGLHKKIRWSAMADFMITDDEMIYKMKEASCIGLKFGVESGNQDILQHIEKPVNFDKLKRNASLCAKLHIKTHGTFTFGLSGETKKTMQQTLDLAKDIDCDSVQFSITTPFPGTRYYKELKESGRLLSENWEDFDGNNTSVVRFDDMDSEYVVDFYKQATGRWLKYKMKQPKWMLRQSYNFFQLIKGQGLMLALKKIKRVFELIGYVDKNQC